MGQLQNTVTFPSIEAENEIDVFGEPSEQLVAAGGASETTIYARRQGK